MSQFRDLRFQFKNGETEGIVESKEMAFKPRRLRQDKKLREGDQVRRKIVAKAINRDEEKIIRSFRALSPNKKRKAIDYLDLLASGKKSKDWVEFDEWAINLAKKKGFERLTEDDVARIVSDFRSGESRRLSPPYLRPSI